MPLPAVQPPRSRLVRGAPSRRPTPAQEQAWPAIATGEHVLISAPTGSGKTLAAFLGGLDRLAAEPLPGDERTRLVYVSPLKALSYDIERNLRAPAARASAPTSTSAIRTGDTPQRERAAMRRKPPDILITTPESLYLILTSQAREMLARRRVRSSSTRSTPSPRRSAARTSRSRSSASRRSAERELQRIGLSATQNPLEEVGRFMVGPRRTLHDRRRGRAQAARPARSTCRSSRWSSPSSRRRSSTRSIRSPAARRPASRSGRAIYPELLELVRQHRSTIVFVNNRRGAERLALRLNELPTPSEASIAGIAAPTTARWRARSARSSRRCSSPASCPASSPPPRSSSASTWAPSTSCSRSSRRSPSSRGLQRIGRAGH